MGEDSEKEAEEIECKASLLSHLHRYYYYLNILTEGVSGPPKVIYLIFGMLNYTEEEEEDEEEDDRRDLMISSASGSVDDKLCQ